MQEQRKVLIQELQQQIMQMGGIKNAPLQRRMPLPLRFLEAYMPNQQLPLGAIHQFVCSNMEQLAASQSFALALCATILPSDSCLAVISSRSFLYPPALIQYGIEPHRVVYIKPDNHKEQLWCTEEALKCGGFTAVLTELTDLNLLQSRRLQLAVEQSGTTGFVLSTSKGLPKNNTAVSRWQVQHYNSNSEYGLPGVGTICWQVVLQKIRNGKPGHWILEYNHQLRLKQESQEKLLMKAV